MKFERTTKIKAPLAKVFECLTDIDHLKMEIAKIAKEERPKLHYDRKNPFKEGSKFILVKDEMKLVFKINQIDGATGYSGKLHLAGKYEDFLGYILYKVNLQRVAERTLCTTTFVSEKSPRGIFSVFLKVYMWLTLRDQHRSLKKYVKAKNV